MGAVSWHQLNFIYRTHETKSTLQLSSRAASQNHIKWQALENQKIRDWNGFWHLDVRCVNSRALLIDGGTNLNNIQHSTLITQRETNTSEDHVNYFDKCNGSMQDKQSKYSIKMQVNTGMAIEVLKHLSCHCQTRTRLRTTILFGYQNATKNK